MPPSSVNRCAERGSRHSRQMDCVDVRYSRMLLLLLCSLTQRHDTSRVSDGELPRRNVSSEGSTPGDNSSFANLDAMADYCEAADYCSPSDNDAAGAKLPGTKFM